MQTGGHYNSNTFKCHVSCTDGKISVRIIYFNYLFSTIVPLTSCVFFPVGLSPLTRHFQHFLLPIFPPSSHSQVVFFPVGLSCLNQETEETTRPVENVALTAKGLQERKLKL